MLNLTSLLRQVLHDTSSSGHPRSLIGRRCIPTTPFAAIPPSGGMNASRARPPAVPTRPAPDAERRERGRRSRKRGGGPEACALKPPASSGRTRKRGPRLTGAARGDRRHVSPSFAKTPPPSIRGGRALERIAKNLWEPPRGPCARCNKFKPGAPVPTSATPPRPRPFRRDPRDGAPLSGSHRCSTSAAAPGCSRSRWRGWARRRRARPGADQTSRWRPPCRALRRAPCGYAA